MEIIRIASKIVGGVSIFALVVLLSPVISFKMGVVVTVLVILTGISGYAEGLASNRD